MFEKIIRLFKRKNRNESELVEAEQEFDERMAEVDLVIEELVRPDKHLQDEYGEMHGKVDNIRRRVDEVVGDKAS